MIQRYHLGGSGTARERSDIHRQASVVRSSRMPCNRGEHTRGGSAVVELFIDPWDRRASPGRPPFLADAGARTFSNVRPASSIRLAFGRLAASTAAIDRAPSVKPQVRGAGSQARSRRGRLADLYLQDFWPAKFLDQGILSLRGASGTPRARASATSRPSKRDIIASFPGLFATVGTGLKSRSLGTQ